MTFFVDSGWNIGSQWTIQSYTVPTNLVLYLDAGNPSSYSGSGTTWTDLSSNNLSGTMNSGVSYSSSSGGSMVFDGTINAYVNFTGASSATSLTNNFSIEAWYKSTNNLPQILSTGSGGSGLVFSSGSGANATKWKVTKYGVVDIYIGAVPQNTNWHQVVVTYSSTAGTVVYVDGAVSGTDASTANLLAGTTNIPIGKGEYGYHSGSISIVRWYNTVLSSSDVSQNFNNNRSRFGI